MDGSVNETVGLNGSISDDTILSGSITGTIGLGGTIDNEFFNGLSAYQVAVKNGYIGTEEEWLKSLKGKDGISYDDYLKLKNIPTINGVAISGDYILGDHIGIEDKRIYLDDVGLAVRMGTTAQWDSEPTYVPEKGRIIIYTDYQTIAGKTYIGMKIGDGNAYLVDLPFFGNDITTIITNHVNDSTIHISQSEREFWNAKSRISEVSGEELIITNL